MDALDVIIMENISNINGVNQGSIKLHSTSLANDGTEIIKSGSNKANGFLNGPVQKEQLFEEKLRQAMENYDEGSLKEVCQQFEALFLQMLYKEMKATVPKSGLFSEADGISGDIMNSMLDEALMNEASKSKGIGIADVMYKQLYKEMNGTYKESV